MATSKECKLKIGFDSCCVSGVFNLTNTSNTVVDACDAGRFSLFVSEDMKVYPCSFQVGLSKGESLSDRKSLKDIWIDSESMKEFREYFKSDRCSGCANQKVCMNGCPLFDDLVVCGIR